MNEEELVWLEERYTGDHALGRSRFGQDAAKLFAEIRRLREEVRELRNRPEFAVPSDFVKAAIALAELVNITLTRGTVMLGMEIEAAVHDYRVARGPGIASTAQTPAIWNDEKVRVWLGLEPFDEFYIKKGKGRQSGRTTVMLCAAAASVLNGNHVFIQSATRAITHYLLWRLKFEMLPKIGLGLWDTKRIHAYDGRHEELWGLEHVDIFRDHTFYEYGDSDE